MRLRDMMVMMLGITDMEAEQVHNFCWDTEMYPDMQKFKTEASVADAKAFFALACDEYRKANNIQTKSL